MADNTIPRNEPGMAHFTSASYQSAEEPRFGEGVADTIDVEVTAGAGGLDLKLYDVVSYNRATKAMDIAKVTSGNSDAQFVLASLVKLAAGQTARFPVYVDGHWDMNALGWHASFNSDELKAGAFEKTRPTILVSKKKFLSNAIDIPN